MTDVIEIENQIIEQAKLIISNRTFNTNKAFTEVKAVADYGFLHMRQLGHEEFHVLILDATNQLKKDITVSTGTIDAAAVYIRQVVKAVIMNDGVSCILMHNHPSGSSKPSPADISITKKIKDALAMIQVDVLDHVIIGDDYFSFAQEGLL